MGEGRQHNRSVGHICGVTGVPMAYLKKDAPPGVIEMLRELEAGADER